MNNQLQSILQGCLNPNTVKSAEQSLLQSYSRPTFMTQLLQMVPNQAPEILVMILSTLKNYCLNRYTHPVNSQRIPDDQKDILRSNLFNFFYQINHNQQAINLYKQVLYIVLSQDYTNYLVLFSDLLKADMQGPIMCSVYFCRQIVHVYEYMNNKDREPLEHFISTWFPTIEGIIQKIMSNYNDETSKLLQQLLMMFYEAFHIEIPQYLRNYDNFDKWILYLQTILKSPPSNSPNNHLQVSKIYVKIMSMYCFNEPDGKFFKGWAEGFRQKYATSLYHQIMQILMNPVGGEDTAANMVTCIYHVCRNPNLFNIIQQDHCQHIIYKLLLPFMQSTQEDDQYFYNDGLQYIRMIEDLTYHPFRRSSLDLISIMMTNMAFGSKSQLMKFIQYSASVLGSNSTDRQKQVILIVLTEINKIVMKNKYLRDNFQNLILQYFLPLIKKSSPIIVSQVLKLLIQYLQLSSLSTPTIKQLLVELYNHMKSQFLVLRYHSILAFTELLDNSQALESNRPYFSEILQIYVKIMQEFEHENLIKSLQKVVKVFSNEIVSVADNLSDHLFNMFYNMHRKQQQQTNNDGDEQYYQANAPLSTIKQILKCPLSHESFYRISQKVMLLLENLCSEYDDYFEDILDVFNILVYASPGIPDYQFPYVLCRKLLQGNNQILNTCSNNKICEIVSNAEKADYQYADTLISILKNLIQKMPEQILKNYRMPTNPQLILCLIENKKLSHQQLVNLNTSEVDNQWSYILQSYTAIVYNVGQVSKPNKIYLVPGISYYPWIQFCLGTDVIQRILYVTTEEQQQDDDDFYEENTAQMLQKFANQDDDGSDYDMQDPNFSSANYSENYCSPFNPKNDLDYLIKKLKQLPQNQLGNMIQGLNQKTKNKLQLLFNQY